MKRFIFFIFFIFLHSSLCIAENKIIAVVGQDIITKSDLENRYNLVRSTNLNKKISKAQILQSLINEKIFLQEAKKQKIEPTKDEIDNAIRNIEIRQGLSKGSLLKKLISEKIPQEAFLEQIKNDLIWDKILVRIVGPSIDISNDELLGFISNTQPDKVHIDAFIATAFDMNQDTSYKNLKNLWDKSQTCAAFKRAEPSKAKDITITHVESTLADIQNLKAKTLLAELHKDKISFIYQDHNKMNFIVICNKRYDMTTSEINYFDNILREKKLLIQAEYYIENLKKKKFIEIYDVNG